MVLRLLLILIALVVLLRLLGWRPPARGGSQPMPRPGPAPGPPAGAPGTDSELVQCSRCAIHVPRGEALQRDGDWYCCAEHRDGG